MSAPGMQVRDGFDLLPLRQAVRASGDASPVLARQALLDGLSKPGRYRIVRHGDGAQILAASEHALAEARLVLRQAYGSLVQFGIPTVHTYVDTVAEVLMVPVMFLRVDAPRGHMQELLAVLEERSAQAREVEVQRDRVVIRVELPFTRALGLLHAIEQLTDGAAQVLSWLLRYERAVEACAPAAIRSDNALPREARKARSLAS
jgi:hypothetical protein